MTEKPTYEELEQKVRELERAGSELRRRVASLENKAENFHQMAETVPGMVYQFVRHKDGSFSFPYISGKASTHAFHTAEEIMSDAELVFDSIHHDDIGKVKKAIEASAKTLENYRIEFRSIGPDGTLRWFYAESVPQAKKNGDILWNGISIDITGRKEAEEALRESEERFRLAFQTSPDAINLNRLKDGTYIDINDGFTDLMGYTRQDVIGKTSLSLNIWKDPEDRNRLVEGLIKTGHVKNLRARFVRKDGEIGTGLMSARVIRMAGEDVILSVTRDITEQSKLERQLLQAQKFEAIGTLAGGIAHDFNNLLMGLQGRASLMSVGMEPSHPHAEHLGAIEEYIRSATGLTKQLLGFARGGKYEVQPVDLNELLLTTATMFGRTKKEIRVHTKLAEPAPVASADRGQIEQVLLNLYVNAWQAMPGGGEFYLETRTVFLEEADCKPHGAEPGRYGKISITDTGIGMDESVRHRIFDPFFTTKGKGRGTGLGLASAYGIVKNHAGIITVYSEPGQGSTFNIYLPLSRRKASSETTSEDAPVGGSETVLLVDDETMILEVGRAMLEKIGYRVVTAEDGRQAVDAVKRMGEAIDLVILDMIMPGIEAGRAFDLIRQERPAVPVILSSGYSLNGQADAIMKKGCNGFIQKPFSIADLSRKIRSVLDGAEF